VSCCASNPKKQYKETENKKNKMKRDKVCVNNRRHEDNALASRERFQIERTLHLFVVI
jgi:hypothetical protein